MPASHRLRKGRYSTEGGIYLLTSTTVNRQPFFADPQLLIFRLNPMAQQ